MNKKSEAFLFGYTKTSSKTYVTESQIQGFLTTNTVKSWRTKHGR